jgi:hypothetical protein
LLAEGLAKKGVSIYFSSKRKTRAQRAFERGKGGGVGGTKTCFWGKSIFSTVWPFWVATTLFDKWR